MTANLELPTRMSPELRALARRVGEFMQYWGFKRIHGQIWTLLFLHESPLDATTLAKLLKVSKALVSLAMKDLLEYDVIQLAARSGKRNVFYRSNPHINEVILGVLRKRERVMLSASLESLQKLKAAASSKAGQHLSTERVNELEDMILSAQDLLNVLIDAKLEPELFPGKSSAD